MPRTAKAKSAAGKAAPEQGKKKGRQGVFQPPLTVSHPELISGGSDENFRQVIYLFVEVLGRLATCREAFGRAIGLTGSQFAILVGVAYMQGEYGVTIKKLSQYVHLASTHVTTEVGRLTRLDLLNKRVGSDDRRSVLVNLAPKGEAMVRSISPFVRRVNDLLFQGVTAADLIAAQTMFEKLARNSEFAIAELKLAERESR